MILATGNSNEAARRGAFTLIELILLMALITIAAALVAPRFSNFFRGRTLDSEARQLLSLISHGQARAVSSGVPVILWIDEQQNQFGLEEEPGYTDEDPDAVTLTLHNELKFQIPSTGLLSATPLADTPSGPRGNLPRIRFQPDGTLGETSPRIIQLIGQDGASLALVQSRDRNHYEIQSATNQANLSGW